jgi:gliding motility-associated-like protein
MRKLLVLLLFPLFTGCFEDEPDLPQYYSKQYIDVAVDPIICASGNDGFDHFVIMCSAPVDSVQWFANYVNPQYLGSGQPLLLPNTSFQYETIRCLGFTGQDTTYYTLQIEYCARFLYIPIGFTPNSDGMNEVWIPLFNFTAAGPLDVPFSVHIEVRTLDGIRVFESDELNTISKGWDGTYNGHRMPVGSYLYYIELDIEGEDPVEYTGWLELFG